MEDSFKVGDKVRETRNGAIQHDQWIWAGPTGKSRALKEGVIIRLIPRFVLSGNDALIEWSDGTKSCRVASKDHLAKIPLRQDGKPQPGDHGPRRSDSDSASLKAYFSPGQRVIETRARCCRMHADILGETAIRMTGTIIKWKDDNTHVVVQWDKVGHFWGVPKRVLARKEEILRVSDSSECDPEILNRLIKKSRQSKRYTWTAWRVESGFLAANDEGGRHTNTKRFDSARELHGFISFLKSVGYTEVEEFDDDQWQYSDDDDQYAEEDESMYLTEDQIARWEEYDSHAYWSGDPDWDNNG